MQSFRYRFGRNLLAVLMETTRWAGSSCPVMEPGQSKRSTAWNTAPGHFAGRQLKCWVSPPKRINPTDLTWPEARSSAEKVDHLLSFSRYFRSSRSLGRPAALFILIRSFKDANHAKVSPNYALTLFRQTSSNATPLTKGWISVSTRCWRIKIFFVSSSSIAISLTS